MAATAQMALFWVVTPLPNFHRNITTASSE